jgi:NAD dependent epimerase/dehydratase
MKVLVTGAGGFIGSHLVEQLVHRGYDVRALVHYNASNYWHNLERVDPAVLSEVEVIAGDVTDPFSIDHAVAGCETVFHLASLIAIPYSYIAPAAYIATNVTGTLNVLQACRRHDVRRMVHTSTSEAYGTAQYEPIDEQHPLVGQSPYSASKIAADKLAESFHRSYGLPLVTVRPFNTYGPRQSARAVIPTIVMQALTQDAIRLGSLSPVRDLTYVDDTARGFVAAAESDDAVGEVLNLGTGVALSVGEMAERIVAKTGRGIPIIEDERRVRPEASEVMRLLSDNRKARQLTTWRPEVDFDAGIERVIAYIESHPEQYKAGIYNV